MSPIPLRATTRGRLSKFLISTTLLAQPRKSWAAFRRIKS